MKKTFLIAALQVITFPLIAQTYKSGTDTIPVRLLDSVYINSLLESAGLKTASDIHGTFIFSGKKSEVISLVNTDADYANKIGRQVFEKVPGVFVYDMDGAGNQINISTRGLDPHRGWEFNIRKDGILLNSDMYGYPASHYSMPLESIDHIELVRGTGSLQYGAQFGGMLNYVTKTGDTSRPFSVESINTVGSYNLLSTYNAISGKLGKFRYYAYMNRKTRNGYRKNEQTKSEAQAIMLMFQPNDYFSVRLEWARAAYQYRLPGQMNDSMFTADPRQATRSRNYYSPDIHVPSITLQWDVTSQTKLTLTSSAVLGKRNSVQFDKPGNIADTINKITNQYNNRQVDMDRYNSYTTELRLLQNYRIGKGQHTLVAGVQYMNNDLHRRQQGKGTTGSDYDLTLTDPAWGRDIHFKTRNVALFAENNFRLFSNLYLNAGARLETGKTDMVGKINNYPDNEVPITIEHRFPLFGASLSYKPAGNIEFYAGWAQAYRPVLFKDVVPGSLYEKVDPDIKDAEGYNVEVGFRGSRRFLQWDITAYLLRYNNRFGTLALTDDQGDFYTWRTNTGNSLTKGIEIFVQAQWMLSNKTRLTIFTATALADGRYTSGRVKSGNDNLSIKDNKIESVPAIISRNGVTLRYWRWSVAALCSYTARSYADALNTVTPSPSGTVGMVPAYTIWDIIHLLKYPPICRCVPASITC